MKIASSTRFLEAILVIPDPITGAEVRYSSPVAVTAAMTVTPAAVAALSRNVMVDAVYGIIQDAAANRGRKASDNLTALLARISSLDASWPSEGLNALWADLNGRMSKALSTSERFNRWGKHYMRALVRAHQIQICANFMDPGLQVYGGALFKQLHTQGGEIFLALPPPTASLRVVEARADQWTCSACTFVNDNFDIKCKACAHNKATPLSRQQSGSYYSAPAAPYTAPAASMNDYYAGAGGGSSLPSPPSAYSLCLSVRLCVPEGSGSYTAHSFLLHSRNSFPYQ